jgi:chromate transporter
MIVHGTINAPISSPPTNRGSAFEMLGIFLKLGLTSFGCPVAHIGYFHQEFVVRRRWMSDQAFADLVGLCQFLPGPASSQVGFSIGLLRAGYLGGLAAWIGFTLPSAVLMILVAYGAAAFNGPIGTAVIHGLKLVAVAIVAQAVWGMACTLCPDRQRASIAGFSAVVLLLSSSSAAQVGAIIAGGLLGIWLCRAGPISTDRLPTLPVSHRVGVAALSTFFSLLIALPLMQRFGRFPAVTTFDAFYRSGALVFGGGHVVLPLLRQAFVEPGAVTDETFLAGYGAAQALPGPLFTFAAYLGAEGRTPPHGVTGAIIGLIGIFLPGMLVLMGTLPFWEAVRRQVPAQAAMRGINAAVVGILGAALYDPVWTSAVKTPGDLALALVGFVLLTAWRASPLLVVILATLGAIFIR